MTNSDEKTVDREAASRENQEDPGGAGAPAGDAGPPQSGSETNEASLTAELEELREKADTYYKNWQRSAADFINYKRRVEQERAETSRFATAALIINLLPVYDDLERAIAAVDTQLAGLNWVQGIMAIQRKFWNMMEAMGVTEIPAEGEDFDPSVHEAVARQPGPEGKVLHVAQKGYRLGDRVIRPAMVIVGQGESEQDS